MTSVIHSLFAHRFIKSGSPRLNVIILVDFVITPVVPVLLNLVISANIYKIDLPLGGTILCWVSPDYLLCCVPLFYFIIAVLPSV